MEKIILFSAILAVAATAPSFLLSHDAELHVPLTSKSTITKSSQHVDHGSTFVHSVPLVHATPLVHASPIVQIDPPKAVITETSYNTILHSAPVLHHTYHVPQKTTVTKSNHSIHHGSTHVVHAPVVHTPIVPVVHSPVVVHSSPLVTLKSGDSAVSHHSSTVHETVPIVKSLSLLSYH
ncbi:unnamed protein product [Diatraea saccharalis]|uniref:Uncharacterized protein n=1 Tax=Diatraea saccharalis TaxID=40085 RepID=A0A9N9R0K1_9NEOP|nr:unnamed protein product [Diatraea saccharalis]